MSALFVIIFYFAAINVTGFIIMGLDKWKARKNYWRIPESTLFTIAIIGGSLGSIIGMWTFRHKTRHWYFVIGMPLLLLVQIAIYLILYFSPVQFIFL